METIKYKQLSWALKIGIVGGWALIIIQILAFSLGYILGLLGL